MTSTDQVLDEQSTNDQSNEVNSDEVETQSQTFEVNGQTLTAEKLLDNYKTLQKEYTQAKQEVSKAKKESELSEEDKAAIDFLRKNNFLRTEDLENAINAQKNESNLMTIINNNPDLKPFEAAIKELSIEKGIAPEDVIEKYGFKSKDKLQKAKSQGDVIGVSNTGKAKSISEMSDKEYAAYKLKMGIGSGGTFS